MTKFERFAGFRRSACIAAAILALPQMTPVHAQRARDFIWKVSSPAGGPTVLVAELPCAS